MTTPKICILTGAVATALLSMGAAQAADEVTTEEVKVTASRVEQDLMEVPMSVTVVTSEQIQKSSARTIGELLEDVPGVQIINSGSQGLNRVMIRGENAFRTLVMIDGQKISEQKSMEGTAVLIDPAQVERIEVIKGPASVLYGSDAIGGAINIITKKGGDKPFGAEASVGWNGAGQASLYPG
ncbi:TonB-dependent siderophore receptor [Sutterella sp.]|uniref:TonB-dependent receptor plug domain-containing protein n=1 Tax=Sutterella sp. TaxID=1981025 RepID=UPI0026E020B4|nr:TonB-dependent receptor plug domain-containing protein [Sutterella sp.]MDO5532245.1 TonB-dependent receptor plug domain-containing protein [Sutterella sp.]